MLIALSIIPLGSGSSISDEIAAALEIIDESGLRYQLTPTGTCIEGAWDEVMPIVRRCHEQARKKTGHVVTTIKIEDETGVQDKLTHNIISIEKKAGRSLRRLD